VKFGGELGVEVFGGGGLGMCVKRKLGSTLPSSGQVGQTGWRQRRPLALVWVQREEVNRLRELSKWDFILDLCGA
jgi:hypothetical protein